MEVGAFDSGISEPALGVSGEAASLTWKGFSASSVEERCEAGSKAWGFDYRARERALAIPVRAFYRGIEEPALGEAASSA